MFTVLTLGALAIAYLTYQKNNQPVPYTPRIGWNYDPDTYTCTIAPYLGYYNSNDECKRAAFLAKRHARIGQMCDVNLPCVRGSFCNKRGVCSKRVYPGQQCEVKGGLFGEDTCQKDSYCEAGICKPKYDHVELGQRCTNSRLCDAGLYCSRAGMCNTIPSFRMNVQTLKDGIYVNINSNLLYSKDTPAVYFIAFDENGKLVFNNFYTELTDVSIITVIDQLYKIRPLLFINIIHKFNPQNLPYLYRKFMVDIGSISIRLINKAHFIYIGDFRKKKPFYDYSDSSITSDDRTGTGVKYINTIRINPEESDLTKVILPTERDL